MLNEFIGQHFVSQAAKSKNLGYVDYGFGQVEPNHLSAQRNGQVYAQLPAHKDINVLEQGQFVKYNYKDGVVDFSGKGEWMLVYNEVKLYREHQMECEFAMLKGNYNARVYSPYGSQEGDRQTRYYNGVDSEGASSIELKGNTYKYDKVTAPANTDPYELHYNEDPFHIEGPYKPAMMPDGTTMVPRVLKTMVGDIYTTNMVGEAELALGDELSPRAADGILAKNGDGSMTWQVVKVYTMPDGQKGVKLMRIA